MKKNSVFVVRLFTTLFLFFYIFAQPIFAIISEDSTAPTVFLTAPIDNFFTNQTTVLQTWDTTDTDIFQYEYRSCSNNPTIDGFCNLIYSQTLTTKSRTVNNNNIAFWWQVRAIDLENNTGEWTDARKITIDTITPSVPQNLRFSNPELSCGTYTNIGINTVDWDNSFDNFELAGYDYNIDYPLISGGRGIWNAFFTNSQHRGPFNEGLHQIKVRAKDKAGNVSAWTPLCDITYDSISPEIPSGIYFRDTDNSKEILCNQYTNTKHLDVYWNAIIDDPSFSHFEYSSFDAPNGSAGLIQKIFYSNYFNSSFWTIPKEGTYGVQLRSVDLAGNKSNWYGGTVGINNSCKFIVDWTAPDVEINNSAEGYVSGVVDIRGTVTDLHPHHYWLAIYSGSTQIAGPGTVNRTDSFTDESLMMWDTTSLPDGVYTIKLEARDAANNKDSGSVDWHTVTVDNTAPVAPEIVFPNPDQYFNTTPILNDWNAVSDDSGIAHYRIEYIYDDLHTFSGAPYRITTATQRNHTPGIWEQGGVKFRVQAFDNAGNKGNWSEWRHYYYDATNPSEPFGLSFEASDGKSLSCGSFTNEYQIITKWLVSTDNLGISGYEYKSFNPPTGSIYNAGDLGNVLYRKGAFTVGEGTYGFAVRAKDLANNYSNWTALDLDGSCKITYDSTLPIVDITVPEDLISGSIDVKATFNDLNPLEYSYSIKNTSTNNLVSSDTVSSSEFMDTTIYTWDTTTSDDGEYDIFFKGTDKAGNYSELTKTVTVDNTKPAASVLGTLSFTVGSTTPRLITLVDNHQLESMCYSFDGSYSCSPISGTSYLWDVSALINSLGVGNFTLSYYVVDQAGNQSDSDFLTQGDVPYTSNITVLVATPSEQVLSTNSTNRSGFLARTILSDEEESGDTSSEQLLVAEPEESQDNSGDVLAETDQQDTNDKNFPWWGYLLIAALLSFIIFLLSRRKKSREI